MKIPERTLTFKVQDNQYEVQYPNTGQLVDMQSLKHTLSSGQYRNLSNSDTNADLNARFVIDMISFFTYCVPNLRKDLAITSYSELDVIKTKKLLAIYVKQIYPWLAEWEKFFNADEEEVADKEGSKEDKERK